MNGNALLKKKKKKNDYPSISTSVQFSFLAVQAYGAKEEMADNIAQVFPTLVIGIPNLQNCPTPYIHIKEGICVVNQILHHKL